MRHRARPVPARRGLSAPANLPPGGRSSELCPA